MTANDTVTVGLWQLVSGATWQRIRQLDTWETLNVEVRHLQPGPWEARFPFDRQSQVIDKKHALTFDYRGFRTTALIEHYGPGQAPGEPVKLVVGGSDALALVGDMVAYPKPTLAIDQQDVAYYRTTGPAETVLTNLIAVNATRRGDGIVLAPSLGRGASVTLNERFSNVLATVAAKCSITGLGIRVGLGGATPDLAATRAVMTCWFYAVRDMSQRVRLSNKVGTLASWSQADQSPTGTRAIVGGGGVGTQRVFRVSTSAAAETEWNRKRELFVDARDTTVTTELDERGATELADVAAQSSFELVASDARGTRFGTHYFVGDNILVELTDTLSTTSVLSIAVLKCDGGSGATVELKPGNPDAANPLFAQAAIVRGLRTQLRALQQEEG